MIINNKINAVPFIRTFMIKMPIKIILNDGVHSIYRPIMIFYPSNEGRTNIEAASPRSTKNLFRSGVGPGN